MKNYALSKRSKQRREGVDYRLIAISDLAIQITPIDFGIPEHGGVRNAAEQAELFDAGLSKCDGYKKLSRHQSGKALDFYAFVNGKASWEREHLAIVAATHLQAASILGYKLQWGGLWANFTDFPHLELLE